MFKKLLIVSALVIIFQVPGAFAHENSWSARQTPDQGGSLLDQLNENIKKQEELKQKIKNAEDQQKTLSNEIGQIENQIELTKLEIEETKTRLQALNQDIDETGQKLEKTKEDLDFTSSVAELRLKTIYKQSFASPLSSFIGSTSFNDFLVKQKYTEAVREQDLQLLKDLDDLKNQFANQKNDLEDKKKQEEGLKAQLEEKETSLGSQQDSKQYVLGVTKNNEESYKKLLSQVQSEIAAISRALGGGGVNLGRVNRGDIVAFQGNSGCSTGTHVHFGLYIGGGAVNPKPYLDSGALRWPENGPTVTQWFGANYWWYMNNFGMPGHNGIDMTAGWGAPILASAPGTAYLATDSAPCWLTGTLGKGIVIHHDNGWKTIYWHIQ